MVEQAARWAGIGKLAFDLPLQLGRKRQYRYSVSYLQHIIPSYFSRKSASYLIETFVDRCRVLQVPSRRAHHVSIRDVIRKGEIFELRSITDIHASLLDSVSVSTPSLCTLACGRLTVVHTASSASPSHPWKCHHPATQQASSHRKPPD